MKKEIKHRHHAMSGEKAFLYSGEFILLIALVLLIVSSWTKTTVQILVPFILVTIALFLTTKFVK